MKTKGSAPEGETNNLCRSCRRTCKQPATLLIASCPRYYAGMKPEKKKWRQLALPLEPEDKS